MFPESDRSYPGLTQQSVCFNVPALVPFDLGLPEWAVYARNMPTLRTTMPETTVDEDGELAFRKVEIRLSLDAPRLHGPPPDSRSDEHGPEPGLGGTVALASDRPHPARVRRGDIAEAAVDQLIS